MQPRVYRETPGTSLLIETHCRFHTRFRISRDKALLFSAKWPIEQPVDRLFDRGALVQDRIDGADDRHVDTVALRQLMDRPCRRDALGDRATKAENLGKTFAFAERNAERMVA